MAKKPKPALVTLGSRSLNGFPAEDVERFLLREQRKGKPAWFDGSFFYFSSGKYSAEWERTNKGGSRMGILFSHNLSLEGILNHFRPEGNEFVSYNLRCLEAYHDRKLQLEIRQRESERKAQEIEEEEQRQITERAALVREIEEWIEAHKIPSCKRKFKIRMVDDSGNVSEEEVSGIVCGYFGIDKRDERGYVVTHLLTGQRAQAGRRYISRNGALRYVYALSGLGDWNFKELEDRPPIGPYVFDLIDYCEGSDANLQKIADAIRERKQQSLSRESERKPEKLELGESLL